MKILNPPVKLSASIIEFLHEFSSRGKECKLEVLIKHFGVSTKYLKLSLSFLSNNSLIIYPSPDIVTLQTNVISLLDKSKANSRKLVLEQFMKLQPFIEFTFFLGKGKSENESIKLVKSLYDIDQDESVILGIFKEWIRLLNIKISTTPFKNETLDGIRDSLQNKLRANNFIKEFLGNNLHNVSEQVITELSDAIKEIPEDNETSVNEAGRALEDFLRIDLAKDVNLTKLADKTEGYTGADLEALCREAGLLSLRKDIKAKTVNNKFFEEALKKIRSSVSKELIDKYKAVEENYLKQAKAAITKDIPSYMG